MIMLGAVFSDIDGTLVHYRGKLELLGYSYLGPVDPPRTHAVSSEAVHVFRHDATLREVECIPVYSATLGGGFCSLRTIELVAQLREQGVKFVVISGARTSTLLKRWHSKAIPACDYYVGEGGGRIWAGDTGAHDDAWIDQFQSIIGPWRDQLDTPPEARVGPLWDCYRRIAAEESLAPNSGRPKMDADSFSTSFMVDVRGDATKHVTLGMAEISDIEATLREMTRDVFEPEFGATMSVNLGKAQFNPIGVDKCTAMSYLCRKHGITLRNGAGAPAPSSGKPLVAAALFDDDNDITFASACDLGYVPSIAHPVVPEHLVKMGPSFERVPVEGLLGTEYALDRLLERVATDRSAA
jgi:hydroxymethylpyrimidine pyrophosphatase-like HAD family hydrolase